jgi:hypothetical protein
MDRGREVAQNFDPLLEASFMAGGSDSVLEVSIRAARSP